jgi:type I site-specific restriction-modification system R (restriction) subunit
MVYQEQIHAQFRLDERHHVEQPLLDQLAGLGWEVIDLDHQTQTPGQSFRTSFTEVVLEPVLREQLVQMASIIIPARAVKLALKRLLTGHTPWKRSGVVWHTQGSGQSMTMMFMIREMYRHPELQQWKVIFVTDRTQLEDQLRDTSQGIGFTVKVATSVKSRQRTGSAHGQGEGLAQATRSVVGTGPLMFQSA